MGIFRVILMLFVHYISYASFRNESLFSVKLPMLPILCHARLPSALTLVLEVQIGRGFERGSHPVVARLQAQPLFPPGYLYHPGKG